MIKTRTELTYKRGLFGEQVSFSLDQAILNPDVAQKTEAETKELLLRSGVWNEVSGIDRAAMRDLLTTPMDAQLIS